MDIKSWRDEIEAIVDFAWEEIDQSAEARNVAYSLANSVFHVLGNSAEDAVQQ